MTTVRRGTSGRHSRALRATAWTLTLMALVSNGSSSRAQGDLTPPTVTAGTPAPGATGVSVQTTVSVVFSEPIQPATPVVELRNSSNQLIPGQLAYDAPTQTAKLTPNAALVGSQTYTVTARSARDLAGNTMTQVSWSFSTASAGFVDVTLPQTGLIDPMVIPFDRRRPHVRRREGRARSALRQISPTRRRQWSSPTCASSVYNFWDRGMLGMALHPNFPATPYIYVLYTYDAVPGGTRAALGRRRTAGR